MEKHVSHINGDIWSSHMQGNQEVLKMPLSSIQTTTNYPYNKVVCFYPLGIRLNYSNLQSIEAGLLISTGFLFFFIFFFFNSTGFLVLLCPFLFIKTCMPFLSASVFVLKTLAGISWQAK